MRGTLLLLLLTVSSVLIACGETTVDPGASALPDHGRYRGELVTPGGVIPFVLEYDDRGVALVDSHERIPCAGWDAVCDTLRIRIEEGSTLELQGSLEHGFAGRWRLRRDAERWTELGCRLERSEGPRFAAAVPAAAESLAERWRVEFSAADDPAVALLATDGAGRATGTFLTTLGDYRYLEGTWDGEQLELACFDGAHAFLFRGERGDDGGLTGDFWSRDSWHETFSAEPDPQAALADGFELTAYAGAPEFGGLAFPDLDGVERRLDAPEFVGRARVLIVFGSWCPNCRDATRIWGELERRYRDRGLKVLGLAFERTADLAQESARLRSYVQRQRLDFPVLVAGLADKARASEVLPLLDRVRAYPTTVFLRGDGSPLAVHTGFTGPAAADEHERLMERFELLLDELLR